MNIRVGIRSKLTFLIGMSFFLLMGLLYFFLQSFIKNDYAQLELNETQSQLELLKSAVNTEFSVQEKLVVDLSQWDAAYSFITSKDSSFIEDNYGEGTLQGIEQNFLLYLNLNGELIYGAHTLENSKVTSDIEPQAYWYLQGKVIRPLVEQQQKNLNKIIHHQDIIQFNGKPLLLTVHGVSTADSKAKVNGFVLLAKYISPAYLTQISAIALRQVKYNEYAQVMLNHPHRKMITQEYFIDTLNPKAFTCNYILSNSWQKPAGVFSVEYPRVIQAKAERTIQKIFWGTLLVGFLLVVSIGAIAHFVFLRRIEKLRNNLKNQGNTFLVEEDKQQDEVSFLQHEINAFLIQLDDQKEIILRKADELLIAKELAEEHLKTKSVFLSQVNHELRTPLAGVIGVLQVLISRETDITKKSELRMALNNSESLLRIVNDLLDLAKIESGKMKLEKAPFSMKELIYHQLEVMSHSAKNKGLKLHLEINPDVPDIYIGDVHRLKQVLINLVGNAIKFTEKGSVRVQVILENKIAEFSKLKIHVLDTGIGISKEAKARLFQTFEQGGAETARKYGGTGLGLAISKDLVELMGGTIHVYSHPGKGSCFEIILKLEEADTLIQDNTHNTQYSTYKLNILGVEDGVTNQWILKQKLVDLGHDIEIAEDGFVALRLLSQNKYDLILMDGRMPGMDGDEVTSHIRKGFYEENSILDEMVYIVGVSANTSDEDQEKYRSAGMNDVIPKPIQDSQLNQCLEDAIQYQLNRGVTLYPIEETTLSASDLDQLLGLDASLEIEEPVEVVEENNFDEDSNPVEDARAKIRDIFITEVSQRLVEIQTVIDTKQYREISRLAHNIKGAAWTLGYDQIAQVSAELEKSAQNEKGDFIEIYNKLKQTIAEEI